MHENKHKADLEEIMQKNLTDYYDELLKDPVACQFNSEQEAQIYWRKRIDETIFDKYWNKVMIDYKKKSRFLDDNGNPLPKSEHIKYEEETQKLVRDYIKDFYLKTAKHSRGCS